MSERHLVDPTTEQPDATSFDRVDFPNAFNVLAATGLKTVGDLRETANETLLSLQGLGQSSVDRLRKSLGVPSTEGIRPAQSPSLDTVQETA
jgi:DNA-directed RNA polymerase alpha subunit